MDLTRFDTKAAAQRGADLELRNPANDSVFRDEETGQPLTIRLLGSDSREYREAVNRAASRRLESAGRSGRVQVSPQQLEEERLDALIAVTQGWTNIAIDDSGPLEFSDDNARTLYSRFPWIREQAEAFVQDRGNYLGN